MCGRCKSGFSPYKDDCIPADECGSPSSIGAFAGLQLVSLLLTAMLPQAGQTHALTSLTNFYQVL